MRLVKACAPVVAALGPVTLMWLLLFVLFPWAQQDFPANDAWCYARGAFSFYRGEGLHYYGYASPTLIGQWLWAWPFVRLFGESHVALSWSTRVLAWAAGLAFYDLLRREGGVRPWPAALATAILELNPWWFILSNTFMTDVPALAVSLVAMALYARACRSGSTVTWTGAGITATLAVLIRQNAVAAPLAAAWALSRTRRKSLGVGVLAILGPLLIAACTEFWLRQRADARVLNPELSGIGYVASKIWASGLQLGLAALPALVLSPVVATRRGGIVLASLSLGIAAVIAVSLYRNQFDPSVLPFLGNVVTVRGAMDMGGLVDGRPPRLVLAYAVPILALTGVVAAAAVAMRLVSVGWQSHLSHVLIPFTALHIILLAISPTAFDRYLVVLVPGLLFILIQAGHDPPAPARVAAAVILLVGMGAISFALMHDWMAWNSARWSVGRRMLARTPAEEIEGGTEWDGWNIPGPAPMNTGQPLGRAGFAVEENRLAYPQITGRFGLSFSEISPHRTIDSEPFRLWLAPGQRRVYLLEYVHE